MEELLRQLIAIQTRIAESQERSNAIPDGLCDRPSGIKYLYLNGKHPTYWYHLGENPDERIDVPQKAIRGILECLNLKTVTSGDGESEKLDIWLKTSSGTYIMRTGWETHTAKSALNALITLSDTQLKSLITFSPFKLADKGTKANRTIAKDVLYFDVWVGDVKVMTQKKEAADEPDYLQMLSHINYLLIGYDTVSPKSEHEKEDEEEIPRKLGVITPLELDSLKNTLRAFGCNNLGTYKRFLQHHGLNDDQNIPSNQFPKILASAQDKDLIEHLG